MKPIYKIHVTEEDDLGIDFNSFVDYPAHMRDFIAFDKGAKHLYNVDEEKRTVTGVMISANTPIYRNSVEHGEHFVMFTREVIEVIARKFFKNGFSQNLNAMHNPDALLMDGAYLFESYIVDSNDPKKPNVPEALTKQKLQDGTWLASYYVHDNTLWDKVKSGEFNGFSVEGWFEKVETKVKTKQSKMSKEDAKKSLFDKFVDAVVGNPTDEVVEETTEENFVEATTAEGVVVSYEGELAEGTMVTIDVDGEMVPAPEGVHELTLEDGSMVIVELDGTGTVVSVEPFEVPEEEVEEDMAEELAKIVKPLMETIQKEMDAKFAKIEAKIDAVKESEKFNAKPNTPAAQKDTKAGWRKIGK